MWAKYRWYIIAGAILLIALILYLVFRAGKKYRPSTVILPPDTQPGGITTFNPGTYTDALYNDIVCWFCTRDIAAWQDLLELSNSQIVAVYNDWNKRYYEKDKQTLVQALKGEYTTSIIFGTALDWKDLADTVVARFQSLGLN